MASSDWDDMADIICRDQMGIEFDGWQYGAGQLLLAKDENDILIHTVGGFHLSAMRQVGKCLDAQTSLLTANRGWTTMSEIQLGDQVFHPSGQITEVIGVSPVWLNHDCYEVTTTDGRTITTDANHLWIVLDKRLGGAPLRNVTTAEMLNGGLSRDLKGYRTVVTDGKSYRTREYRFTLPPQQALCGLPNSDLIIDPYLLGAWLGNGNSAGCILWSGDQDVHHWIATLDSLRLDYVKRLNVTDSGSAWALSIQQSAKGCRNIFTGKLRELSVLGNKHIPKQYLAASTDQRLALLQGLLDTDGHITKQSGTIEFCSMTKDLADGVLFLARSLGWRATVREGKAKLDGRDYGVKYRITFTPKRSDPYIPFRLQRKIDRIGQADGGKGRFTVAIKSIEPVATRPVRCIKVAAEDGLFLAGCDLIPTHNTHFVAGALFGLSVKYDGLLSIWSAHHSRTHDETFETMQNFAASTRVKPFIKRVLTGSGTEAIEFTNGSRILFGARDRGFPRGIPGVDALMCDEGQILSEKSMQNMIATMNTSALGLHIYAGTPPATEELHKAESWMRSRGEAWAGGKDGPPIVETEDMVWIEIGADDGCDLDDREQWMKNPSYPHRTPIQAFMRLRRKLNDDGFRREGLGVYDEDDGTIFDLTKWSHLAAEDAQQPDRAVLVLDVSPDRRWCALGIAGDLPLDSDTDMERTLVVVKSIRGTDTAVRELIKLNETRDLMEIAITNGAARALETDLVKAGIEYETLTQSEMSAAYGTLQRSIKDGTVAHIDQSELNFALANAKSRYLQTGEAESFDRREYSVDISPAVAVAGALYRWGLTNYPMPLLM